MSKAELKARGNFNLGHRTIKAGEVLASIDCASKEDLVYIVNHLRWSAFEFTGDAATVPTHVSTIKPPTAQKIAYNSEPLLTATKPHERAQAPIMSVTDEDRAAKKKAEVDTKAAQEAHVAKVKARDAAKAAKK